MHVFLVVLTLILHKLIKKAPHKRGFFVSIYLARSRLTGLSAKLNALTVRPQLALLSR